VKLEVVDAPSTEPLPTFPVIMADWNFDDKPVWYEYHYEWSQNEMHAVATGGNNANGTATNDLGKDGTSGWFLTLDTTEFNNAPPEWAGGGSGGGGPVNYDLFDSPDLASYRVTFDARVLGLAEERTNSAAVLQLFLDSPDDTFQPADEDTNADAIVRLDIPISKIGPEWQTYSAVLSKASAGSGSKDNFTNHFAAISDLRTQWQIENAGSMTDWGFDPENTLVIDNFKLERLYTGLSAITPVINGSNLVLNWNASAPVKLQAATSVEGPYTEIAGATSGYSTPLTGQYRFFRLAQ
jgi:hypothetical protein